MKTAKELKKYVFSRVMRCCGELCTIFFLTVGGLAIFVLACIIAAELLSGSGRTGAGPGNSVFPYGKLFLICTAVFILLSVASTPFFYGVCWYRMQQVRGNSVHARSIFSCYTSLGKLWSVLRLNSILIIKKLYIIVPAGGISALFFFIAGLVEDHTGGGFAYYAVFFLASAVTAGMLCLIFVFNVKYAAVPCLYVLEPGRSAAELISTSKKLMRENIRYLCGVMLSLTGWFVPCLIIFPIVFIAPYIQMVYTAAMNEIILSECGEEVRSGGNDDPGKRLFLPEGTS